MAGIRVKNGSSQGQTFAIGDKPLIVGRDETCGLSLQDKGASRQHAEIFKIGDMCFIRDLESKNGTFVNDSRIGEEMLRDGDRIQIGGTVIVFEPFAGRPDGDLDFTEEELDGFYELRLEDLTAANVGEGDVSSERHLRALYRLSRLVAGADAEEELASRALAFVADVFRADGAYLFGRDSETGGIATLASHSPKGSRSGQLSRTIIRKVLQDKRALLVTDAMRDDRFSANESVLRHNIHAVICAPLTLYAGAECALYVAGDDPAVSFTEQELELTAAMADQIGLALAHIGGRQRRRDFLFSVAGLLLRVADANRPGIRTGNERLAGRLRAIGAAMGLNAAALERLQLAGLLHNYSEMIGLGDPAAPEERLADTVDMLSREPFFPEIEQIVVYQLERYDGGGPKKLRGAEIPLEARVFQAARDLEERMDGKGGAEDLAAAVKAMADMTSQSGGAYDPEVMTAMTEAERNGTLGLSLEEQWRRSRSARMTSLLANG